MPELVEMEGSVRGRVPKASSGPADGKLYILFVFFVFVVFSFRILDVFWVVVGSLLASFFCCWGEGGALRIFFDVFR